MSNGFLGANSNSSNDRIATWKPMSWHATPIRCHPKQPDSLAKRDGPSLYPSSFQSLRSAENGSLTTAH